MSASELKAQGNKLFTAGHFAQAIECYSKAAVKEPGESKYLCNRALCHIRLQRWQEAVLDCRRALELNASYVKAHFFLGEALVGLEQYDDGIAEMVRAQQLACEQSLYFGDEITTRIRDARRRRWLTLETVRMREEIELQSFLKRVLEERRCRQVQEVEARAGGAGAATVTTDQIDEECRRRQKQVDDLFAQVDQRRQLREVPDYLCGKISFELMRDPCITPSGITYERKSIEEHLQRVGHFDPITRQSLTTEQLIPNLAMKEVIDAFVEKNGWVEDY